MAKKKKKKVTAANDGKSARLNLMIDPRLKEWAHKYARRRSTSISAIITGHLSDLRERERGDGVSQI
jgi:hypothetical protein